MKTYFALFLISTIASLVTTPLIRRLCERLKLLDVPIDGRRIHRTAIPRLGGVALYLSCLSALSLLPLVDNLLTETLSGFTDEFLMLAIPATLVLLVGIYDDLRGTNAVVKFAALGFISSLFYAMGGRIDALSIPLFGPVQLPGLLSFVITVVLLVGVKKPVKNKDRQDGVG